MQVWDYVIQPACQALGIEPVRADMIAESGEITEQVCQHLRDDDLVIADVTGGNANVMYELGLRHTRSKLTIQIGEKERLPFDITVIRTIQFIRTETGLVEARESLQEAIRVGIERGPRPVTATRVWLELGDDQGPIGPDIVEFEGHEHEEPGFLDMQAEAEEAVPLLAKVTEEITLVFTQVSNLTEEATQEIAKSDERGAGAAGRLRVARNLAENLEEPTNQIEQLAADFVVQLERMAPGISHYIDLVEEDVSILDREEAARQFVESIRELAQAAGEALPQVAMMADAAESLGGISNRLRPVSRRMSIALRRISNSSSTIQEWGQRLDSAE